jgi:hypothetical protein
MHVPGFVLSAAIALALPTGCTGGNNIPEADPGPLQASALINTLAHPERKTHSPVGIYASEFEEGFGVLGYPAANKKNKAPLCSVGRGSGYINEIAVDAKGDLIVPAASNPGSVPEGTVLVYKGPRMCGKDLGSFSDPYGQPASAASRDAATGKIVVGNIVDNGSTPGSVSICSMATGCSTNLTNSNLYEVAGVALAPNGDCWASGDNYAGGAVLVYFKGCTGSGELATGFQNVFEGGLDIDNAGNLVSISAFNATLYVYQGCNPSCTLVGSYSLNGESFGVAVFVHGAVKELAVADLQYGQVDVYDYDPPSAVSFEYDFNNGLNISGVVEGVAISPHGNE